MEKDDQICNLTGARVVAAMSGGVDSSVTALLLRDAGADVAGVTMRLYGGEEPGRLADAHTGRPVEGWRSVGGNSSSEVAGGVEGMSGAAGPSCAACAGFEVEAGRTEETRVRCSLDDIADAQDVCHLLGLRHLTLDCTEEFADCVMDPFCESYLRGETPNPCIECNRHLKFSALQRFRAQMGYDYVATGHYVRRRYNAATGRYELLRARDVEKDQSYVLYSLTQEQLAHTLFPLGDLTKPEVRAMASAAGFGNAEKSESQDICFVPDGDYLAFIRRRTGRALEPGDIVDRAGRVLGRHGGLAGYTIGQRKGIRVAAAHPLFVCGKDLERNRLIVGPREDTYATRVRVRALNMVSLSALERPTRCEAKLSYRQAPRPAVATQIESDVLELAFDEPVRATAPGQAAVLYDGDLVLGGGTIERCW